MNMLKNQLVRLWKDEQGAEKIEYILLIAAIALPIVAILIFFAEDVIAWLSEQWDGVRNNDIDHDFGGG